jgi:hypothetical protein
VCKAYFVFLGYLAVDLVHRKCIFYFSHSCSVLACVASGYAPAAGWVPVGQVVSLREGVSLCEVTAALPPSPRPWATLLRLRRHHRCLQPYPPYREGVRGG